jgi:hypothetical protein
MDEIIFNDTNGKVKMKLTNDKLIIEELPKKAKTKDKEKEEKNEDSKD